LCIIVTVYILTHTVSGACTCSPTYEQDMSEEPDLVNKLVSNESLVRHAHGYVVDLWVYDDHFTAAKSIQVNYC